MRLHYISLRSTNLLFGKFEADDLICQCQCQMADRSEKAWRRRGLRDSYGHGSGPVLSDGSEISVLQFAV